MKTRFISLADRQYYNGRVLVMPNQLNPQLKKQDSLFGLFAGSA